MRAKPEMKPWVHTDKSGLSSVGAALTERAFALDRIVSPLQGSSTLSPPINYLVIFMGLRWLALRRGLTESAIIRIFAKI
ncbi:MAG: hypothetical protein D8B41_04745 [Porphyromonas sp.]|nr:MAG: hypothetical protein D8B41_04745 [Porphyromonas sp.]